MLESYRVILASNSPRRKELLAGVGISFEVMTIPGIDESFPDTLKGGDIPLFLARKYNKKRVAEESSYEE